MEPDGWQTLILILILIVLILLSSFFSAAETALIGVNRLRLRALSDNGNAKAALTLRLLEEQQTKLLTTILICNNIVNLSASAIAGTAAARLGGWGIGAGTAVITLLILVFGEISPKTAAAVHAERTALRDIRVIHVLMIVLTPLIAVVNALSRVVLWFMRVNPNDRSSQTTEEELRTMVEVSHEDGVIENEEKEMINNVFDLTDSQARDIMVPRVDVECIRADADYEEMIRTFSREKHTRLPVYEDNPDNIIGILNMKDILLYDREQPFAIKDFIREAHFTHEFKNTYELFLEMRKKAVSMSIVLDEYGIMAGVITMEDILEEIVGEIRDEFDEQELNEIRRIGERDYIVEGSMSLYDINDQIGTNLVSEDYDSIGGYMIGLLDHFPNRGEQALDHRGNLLRAVEVDGNHIERIRLTLAPEEKKEAE